MRIPKRYGESKRDACPFCKRQALTSNAEGVPVCIDHKNSSLPDLKCVCGSILTQLKGKFGIFFNCMKCGNVSQSRVFEMNDVSSEAMPLSSSNSSSAGSGKPSLPSEKRTLQRKEPSEIVVRADDPFYCG
jgi:hypothetical protein